MTRQVRLFADERSLATAAAEQLTEVLLVETVRAGRCDVALTGGGVGTRVLAELAAAASAVDWRRVHLWWSDERYSPAGSADRNEVQARLALIDQVPIPTENVHPMPADDGTDVATAAHNYAAELAAARPAVGLPDLAVALLGIGPDGHVASLFPGHPALWERAATTVAVRDSPKPPPTRISFTLDSINSARQVWVLAAGGAKAQAISRAWSGPVDLAVCPASAVRGTEATTFWIDQAAASHVPPH